MSTNLILINEKVVGKQTSLIFMRGCNMFIYEPQLNVAIRWLFEQAEWPHRCFHISACWFSVTILTVDININIIDVDEREEKGWIKQRRKRYKKNAEFSPTVYAKTYRCRLDKRKHHSISSYH